MLAGLRQVDARFDLVWNPRAILVRYGSYDARGQPTAPRFDGRWEVVLRDTATKTAGWRGHTRVCLVTEPVRIAPGIVAMQDRGPYAPIGWWLVEFFQAADLANREGMARLSGALDAINDAVVASELRAGEAGEREAAERMFKVNTMRGGVSELHPVRIDFRQEDACPVSR